MYQGLMVVEPPTLVTSDCGILHMLEPGGLVLADKGFPQNQECSCGARIKISDAHLCKTK